MNNVTDFTITSYTEGLNDFMLTFKWTSPVNVSNLTGYHLYQTENDQDVGVKLNETTNTSYDLQYYNVPEPAVKMFYVLPVYSVGSGDKSNTISVTLDKTIMQRNIHIHYGLSDASMRTFGGRFKIWT